MTDVPTGPEQAAPNINLHDLKNLLQIIDIAAERGTFRGNELSSVGSVRDKLAMFLTAAAKAEEAAAAEAEMAEGQPDAVQPAETTPKKGSRKKGAAA